MKVSLGLTKMKISQERPQPKFERIHALTSEIIDATDGLGRRTTDEFRFHDLW